MREKERRRRRRDFIWREEGGDLLRVGEGGRRRRELSQRLRRMCRVGSPLVLT
jgi:hypothetical protein